MTGRPDPRVINGSSQGVWSGRPSPMSGPQPVTDDLPSPRRCAAGAAAPLCSAAQTSFLRHLVHDLRGPARALEDIPGWLSDDLLAAGTKLPENCARLLPLLVENASRLDGILAGLGDWIAAGDPPSDPRPAEDPAAVLMHLGATVGCDVRVDDAEIPLAATDLTVVAHAAFVNAAHFNPEHVQVAVTVVLDPGEWKLVFLDDGVGPPVTDAARLVAPLARASVGEAKPGAGFGLAVIDRVAARYGGQVAFGVGPGGRGAALCLRFPRYAVTAQLSAMRPVSA